MHVTIRKFMACDIENKINWINNPENNRFLHYDLPLEYEKTCAWFEKAKDKEERYDAVIETDGKAVGLIGLLSIDRRNKKAEYYITIGETAYKGKGLGAKATLLLLGYAFDTLKLTKIYLYTETGNVAAQRLFERIGFQKEGLLRRDLFYTGKYIDRLIYGITEEEYRNLMNTAKRKVLPQNQPKQITPIQFLGDMSGNKLYMKREDLIPYSFGGNKARKGRLFFKEIEKGDYDCVVTYGGSHSNHCRIIANMAAQRGISCFIIAPTETSELTFNRRLVEGFGAEIVSIPVEYVQKVIKQKLDYLKSCGRNPYFIPGGGHGNIGTQAYVNCYQEICSYENTNSIHFDYIFLASGTGTTQAGLICGQLLNDDERRIVGISVAREKMRGRGVVLESVREYLMETENHITEDMIQEGTDFIDDYIGNGYGKTNADIGRTIKNVMVRYGIPLDGTYTGKAFHGMEKYIQKKGIKGKNVLFIHTGGTPLFFDDVWKW